MRHGTTRTRYVRVGLSVLLGYVLALQLGLTALAGSAMAAQALDRAPGAFAAALMLCAPSAAPGKAGDPSVPAHGHDGACCTIACHGVSGLVPPLASLGRPAPALREIGPRLTADLGARPATAPPRGGGGPRAPPFDLI